MHAELAIREISFDHSQFARGWNRSQVRDPCFPAGGGIDPSQPETAVLGNGDSVNRLGIARPAEGVPLALADYAMLLAVQRNQLQLAVVIHRDPVAAGRP